ncbi:MAG: hypothetical protein E6J26_10475 [Chloroflexi bacterium]|nr:MAG: hypothetical protein E6J26_10475 [Chloroflexota bacterium]
MRKILGARLRHALALAVFLCLITTRSSLAANIVVDGQFADWAGKPNLTDPAADVTPARDDLTAFYWATNPGDPTTYFMVQRSFPGGNTKGFFHIFIDTNCNGNYGEATDRAIYVTFDPNALVGLTTVDVYAGNSPGVGAPISTASGNWGNPAGPAPNDSTRTEFGVSFANLGISANLDRIPGTGDITWTPIPALDYPLLALVVGGVVVVVWKRKAFAGWGLLAARPNSVALPWRKR